MAYETEIREADERAGRALTEARRIGKEIGTDGETSERKEAFDRAYAAVHAAVENLNHWKKLAELETVEQALQRPASSIPHQAQEPERTKRDEFKAAHHEAFDTYIRRGGDAAVQTLRAHGVQDAVASAIVFGGGPKETHALLGTSPELGGFAVPDDFRAQVLRDMAARSAFRSVARIERTSRDALVWPTLQSHATSPNIYPTGFTGSWRNQGYVTGGTAPTVQDQPKWGQLRIAVHGWQPDAIELSHELLEDAAVSIDGVLAEVLAEHRALDEDSAFTNGTGASQPNGLLNDATVATVNTGDANLLKYGGLLDLWGTVPAQYRMNATWMMRSLTYAAILKLEDTATHLIFAANTTPGTLWQRPIAFNEFMPAIAASAKPIALGDFRHYIIADRQELRLQRLLERFAPNVGILPHARVGGAVARPQAFRFQVVSA